MPAMCLAQAWPRFAELPGGKQIIHPPPPRVVWPADPLVSARPGPATQLTVQEQCRCAVRFVTIGALRPVLAIFAS